jgi:hypothetical protein
MPVALVTISPLAIISSFGDLPSKLVIPTIGDVYGMQVGYTAGNFKLVNVVTTPDQPPFTTLQSSALSLNGNTLTITRTFIARVITTAELLIYASSKQEQLARSGTQLGNTPIPTDLSTLMLLTLAYTKSLVTPAFTMQWLVPSVSPDNPTHLNALTLTATNIQNAAQQVGIFLADTLARKATAVAGINAGTVTTIDQVDAIFSA